MKKILTLMVAVFGLVIGGLAQNHEQNSMLNVRALFTGTNSLGRGQAAITNLSVNFTNVGSVLATNVVFTNNAGAVVRSAGAAGGTNTVSTFQLFKSAPLYVDRDGKPIFTFLPNPEISAYSTNSFIISPTTLKIRLANPYGSNGPVGFIFAPLWDGTNISTSTRDDWTVVIAGATCAVNDLATNVPTWRWPGAKSFALRAITNEFNPTAAADVTNCPALVELKVVGFRP